MRRADLHTPLSPFVLFRVTSQKRAAQNVVKVVQPDDQAGDILKNYYVIFCNCNMC